MVTTVELVIYGLVSLVVGVFGGIAGGGGGFVMTPLAILFGLSPAEAVASGKFSGLAMTVATLQRLRRERLHSRNMVLAIMALAAVVGLVAPLAIVRLEGEVYRTALGALLLAMLPLVFFTKVGRERKVVSSRRKGLGWVLLAITMFIQGIFSGGLGMLVNLVLMGVMGMTALEATVTKRFSQLLLNGFIVVGLLSSGLIVWELVAVGSAGAFIGARLGVHLAVKKGNRFINYVFAVFMLIAALELLLG